MSFKQVIGQKVKTWKPNTNSKRSNISGLLSWGTSNSAGSRGKSEANPIADIAALTCMIHNVSYQAMMYITRKCSAFFAKKGQRNRLKKRHTQFTWRCTCPCMYMCIIYVLTLHWFHILPVTWNKITGCTS